MARALALLEERFPVVARSRLYESAAVGDPGGPAFLNRAVLVRCGGTAREMRAVLQGIERDLGRVRTEERNAPRTIDIDLLLAMDATGAVLADPVPDEDLRRHHHAALPAAEVAGNCVLPGDGGTLADLARSLGPPPPGFRVAGP